MCVFVCVCERERERERESKTEQLDRHRLTKREIDMVNVCATGVFAYLCLLHARAYQRHVRN